MKLNSNQYDQRKLTAHFCVCLVSWFAIAIHSSEIRAHDETGRRPSANSQVDFATQIMPIFSRYGCNAAECHGSATGRGDFKLSLFGGDPEKDYNSIVNQLEGRRVNFAAPEKSLLLNKPAEMLAHGGGEIFELDSAPAKRIQSWIREGASSQSRVQVTGIKANQDWFEASAANNEFQIHIFSESNLGRKNVTEDSTFSTSNPSAVKLSGSGKVKILRPGKYYVVAKYLQYVVPITVIRPFENENSNSKKLSHPIDRTVQQSLTALKLPFPPTVSDATYVRRLYLDLTGHLPSVSQARSYIESNELDKKEKLVNRILESPAFQDYWAFWLRRVIQFRTPGNDKEAARSLNKWIKDSVKKDLPWSELAGQFVTSQGDTTQNPAANFHRFFADARGEAETVATSFLGFRIGCANCHNHPLDQWTQEDYHGLAAIFATLKRGKTISELPDGTVIQPKTGKPAIARIPGRFDLKAASSYRNEFAGWMTQSNRFKHSIVNRVWKHFMGRGIVEPIDDFRSSNPPIDQQLLELLAKQFEQNEFRFKPFIRSILLSELYASQTVDGEPAAFWAGYVKKTMATEVLHDACRQVLYRNSKSKLDAAKMATINFELVNDDQAMRLLKGCDPRGDCIAGESPIQGFGLREKLHLINGKFLNRWIHDSENQIAADLEANQDLLNVLSLYYWRALSRNMTAKETEFWKHQIVHNLPRRKSAEANTQFLQDAVWTLLNSREFTTIN